MEYTMIRTEAKDGEGKTKRSCKEVKCKLVDYDSLPSYLKDNEFILDYYRCEWPLKQTILSIFSLHNETLNIWTHLIGFFVFLALTICAATMIQRDTNVALPPNSPEVARLAGELTFSLDNVLESLSAWSLPQVFADHSPQRSCRPNHTSDGCYETSNKDDPISSKIPPSIPRWPFITFMCGAMTCLLASSACHLLSCTSKRCSYIMLRLDYIGISTLIVTSFYPLVYYSFMCDPFIRDLYNGSITAFGVVITMISLLPIFQTPKFRVVRSLLFLSMGAFGLVPILHKMVAFQHKHEAFVTTGYELASGGLYVVGVVLYTTRVPERWKPGKFDLAGHSHQLFHLLVIAGAYAHYLAGLVYLEWREMERC